MDATKRSPDEQKSIAVTNINDYDEMANMLEDEDIFSEV
jgi:hypothetical protein